MIVTVSGRSGLTNAYVSVLSATGSLEISGASRCDDMVPPHRLCRDAACMMRRTSCGSLTTTSSVPWRIETSPSLASWTQNMTGSLLTHGEAVERQRRGPALAPSTVLADAGAAAAWRLRAPIGTATAAAPAVTRNRSRRDQVDKMISSRVGGPPADRPLTTCSSPVAVRIGRSPISTRARPGGVRSLVELTATRRITDERRRSEQRLMSESGTGPHAFCAR